MKRSAPDPELRATLDRIVADGIRPVSAGLALVYAGLGLVWRFMPDHVGHEVHLPMAWTTAVLLFVLSLVLRRRPLPPRLAHPAAAVLAAIVLVNSVVDLAMEKPDETVLLVFLVVGAGALFLSWRWLGVVLASTAASWLAVAAARWGSAPGKWLEFGAYLVIAVVLAVGLHALRLRSVAGIEQTRRYYTGLIDGTSDVIAVVDQEAVITYVSPSVERVLGWKPEERLGMSGLELIHPEDLPAAVEMLEQGVSAPGAARSLEVRLRHRDGSWRILEAIATNLLDEPAVEGIVVNARDVTDRRRAEEAVTVARERLERIAAASLDAIVEIDDRERITFWNEGAQRLFGYAASEVLGRKLHDLCASAEDGAAFERGFEAFRRTGEGRMVGSVVEVEGTRRDGTRVPVELSVGPVPLDGVWGAVGIVRDVTDRRRAEREVRLLETIALAIAEAPTLDDALGTTLRMVCEATGWAFGEACVPRPDGSALQVGPAWHASDAGLETFRRATEACSFAPGEGLPGRVWASKRSAWIPNVVEDPNFPRAPTAREAGLRAAVGVPVLADDEVVAVMDFFVRDVREEDEALVALISGVAAQLGLAVRRKKAEEQLRESEEKYRVLVEDLPAIPYIDRADDSLETIYVGPQIADILGVSQEEYLTDPHLWERHIHAEDRQRALDAVYDFIRTDREADYLEYRWVRPDGRVVWINDRTVKVRDADGRALMLQGVMFDVTQRKEAEEARRETEARFRTLVEHIPAAFHISGLDETASTIYISPQVEAILGYAPEEWVADDELWLKLLHPDDRERAVAVNRHHVTTHGPMSEDYRMIARDGRVVWIHDESVVMRDEQGRPLNAQGILLDITERKEDEELLRAGEEELRRSLEVLRRTDEERRQLLTRLLAAQEEERERVAEDIQDDSIQHMAAVGIRLETLRRQLTDPSQLGAVDQLGRTVEEAVGRLRHLLLELRPRILEKDGLAPALREYLESMAAEAGFSFAVDDRLAEEPPLEVRTAAYRIAQDAIQNVRDHARAGLVEVALSERDGGLLCRVTDDGVGFDPLAGSEAMGLAAMRERTELAGGWVRVRSAPGAGTTVEFWLPCEGPPGGGETAPAS